MRTTPEKLVELKTMAEHAKRHFCIELAEAFVSSVPALIADLEEARGMAVALAPDALREAEERKNIAAGLEAVWQGRMQDAETAHQAELAATRKKLVAAQTLLGKAQAHKFFCLTELRRVQDVMLSEAGLGIVDARIYELTESAALDAAIAEAIEPYRKDAERLDLLGKLCKKTPLRPNAFCSEIAPDTRLRYEFPTLVSYDSVGQQISLRDAIDAAIAAKGESE